MQIDEIASQLGSSKRFFRGKTPFYFCGTGCQAPTLEIHEIRLALKSIKIDDITTNWNRVEVFYG